MTDSPAINPANAKRAVSALAIALGVEDPYATTSASAAAAYMNSEAELIEAGVRVEHQTHDQIVSDLVDTVIRLHRDNHQLRSNRDALSGERNKIAGLVAEALGEDDYRAGVDLVGADLLTQVATLCRRFDEAAASAALAEDNNLAAQSELDHAIDAVTRLRDEADHLLSRIQTVDHMVSKAREKLED